jgi:uncharacterized membrane protein
MKWTVILTLLLSSLLSVAQVESPQTKEKRLRELRLQQAELALQQAKANMARKKADLEAMQELFDKDVITKQELNRAKEEYDRAVLEYENARLKLQQTELDTLKEAWHIAIQETRLYETKEGRKMLDVTLHNTSQQVYLRYTSRLLGEKVMVSAEIENIVVSIKDPQGSIIAQPYEQIIPKLGYQESKTLKFELIKEVQDVVVSLKYMDVTDERTIHLRSEEPYITIVNSRKYKAPDGTDRLEISLRYGTPGGKAESEMTAIEISRVVVSVQDELGAIIGIPLELKIPSIKLNETKILDFQLRKNVDKVTVSLNYLGREHSKMIYLEPEARYVSILQARKYRTPDGLRHVQITLKNTSKAEAGSPDEVSAANEIRDLYVSLKDERGTIIAQPYEVKVDLLTFNQEVNLDFTLQKDVDEVTVSLNYLGRNEEKKVYLQKESAEDVVSISSLRFSQEGNLGGSVSYDLVMDRLAESERTFQLKIINLPQQLSYQFLDPQTNTRLSQLKFTREHSRYTLSLVVYIPETFDLKMLDKPIRFAVAVVSSEEAERLGGEERMQLTEDQIKGIRGGVEWLELVPRGVAEMELWASNLYHEIKRGEEVTMSMTLKNIGTRRLSEIRMEVITPPRWREKVSPEVVGTLDLNGEREVRLTFIPPEDADVGDYEVKVKAGCEVEGRLIEIPEKTVRIHISAPTSISMSAILVIGLIVMIGAVAFLTVKISRR